MIRSIQSAVEETLNSSPEDPEVVLHEAMLAVISFAKSKDVFHSPRTVRNLENAVSHGEAGFKIDECRKAVENSTVGCLVDALQFAWDEETHP